MKLKKYIISFALILFISTVYAEFPAKTFNERIQKLNLKVPVNYHLNIDQYLDPWLGNSFNKTSVLLGKGDHYLPYIQKALKEANMPMELQYIPAALSAFGPQRVSEDGGTGIWQMTYRKARQYDLHISSYVDERRDYKKATDAALKYLADLHKMLGRWDLAIAAFYADPIEVNKAIRMAGKGNDVSYWAIHEHLQARHQMAFPSYCASVYVFNYYKEHRIVKKTYSQVDTAQVKIMDWITFSKLSEALELKESEIEELNPTFKRAMIPHSDRTYYAIIPKNKKARFETLGDSVYRFAEVIKTEPEGGREELITPEERAQNNPPRQTTTTPTQTGGSGTTVVYYTVRSGDVLGKIADWYDCYVSSIKRWNGLHSDRIDIGQKLKIYVPEAKKSYYLKINSMSASQKAALANQD